MVAGKPRTFLRLIESGNSGDVRLLPPQGLRPGIHTEGATIKNDRFSIHFGTLSPENSTIKRTVTLSDGTLKTSAAVTNAIKSRGLFTHIVTVACQDLNDDKYTARPNPKHEPVDFGDLSKFQTLVFSAAVSAPREEKADQIVDGICIFGFEKMSIHLHVSNFSFPAPKVGWSSSTTTYSPESVQSGNPDVDGWLRGLMKGKPLQEMMETFAAFEPYVFSQQLAALRAFYVAHSSVAPAETAELVSMIDDFVATM